MICHVLADSGENLSSLLMVDGVVFDCAILRFWWYCVYVCSGWELKFLVLWVADCGGIV
jgi:hypothetical protein